MKGSAVMPVVCVFRSTGPVSGPGKVFVGHMESLSPPTVSLGTEPSVGGVRPVRHFLLLHE